MARPPAFRLYCGELATIHASNNLQELIKRAKLHGEIFKKRYLIRDLNGSAVWEGDYDERDFV